MTFNLSSILRESTRRDPGHPAIVTDDETISYGELSRRSDAIASGLIAAGLRTGEAVMLQLPNIPSFVAALHGILKAGGVIIPTNTIYKAGELSWVLENASVRFVITSDASAGEAAAALATVGGGTLYLVGDAAALEAPAGVTVRPFAELAEHPVSEPPPFVQRDPGDTAILLYTSGTTGKPKGVQRDVGGYAVALAASMKYIYCGNPGETYFSSSDIGWVVGHSYIVYGPLLAGMATIMYEGTPVRPDAGILWQLVERFKVTVMFSAPTAIRVLKKQDPAWLTRYDTSSLRALFLAGEPLDEPTAKWIAEGLGRPVIDNYWQTETGWPILTVAHGIEKTPTRFGSPGMAMYGYDVRLLHEQTGEEVGVNEKGVIAIVPPLPPGCMQTVWRDDRRFVDTYFTSIPGRQVYSTFDWGIRDADGYYFILGRTDDVINVAGHRLGTREIEESISSHPAVAECAVVGVADQLKGQVAIAFAVLKDAGSVAAADQRLALEGEIMRTVDRQLGAVARPGRVHFVTVLPKTRSGKVLRRSIQALCEGRDPGDLTTIEDPAALEQVRSAVTPG